MSGAPFGAGGPNPRPAAVPAGAGAPPVDAPAPVPDPPSDPPSDPAAAGGQVVGLRPDPARRGPRETIDWPAVKATYVEGVPAGDRVEWPTIETVADLHGLSTWTVRGRSSAEGWVDQRRQWQQRVESQRQAARAADLAARGTALDSAALQAAELGLQLVTVALRDDAQAAQAARSAGGPGTASRIDVLRQTRIAQAAELWHKIGSRALGDPGTQRVEVTGAGGRPLEVAHELRRDDPARMAAVLSVLEQAGLGDVFAGTVVDGTVVSDTDDEGGGP